MDIIKKKLSHPRCSLSRYNKNIGRMEEKVLLNFRLYAAYYASFLGMHDGLEASMFLNLENLSFIK